MVRAHGELRAALDRPLSLVDLFRFPTVAALAEHLGREAPDTAVLDRGQARARTRLDAAEKRRASAGRGPRRRGRPAMSTDIRGDEIAIIGLAGRWPGAPSPDAFWRNLRDGVESVRRFTDDELRAAGERPDWLADPGYVKARPVLDDADRFDAGFFGSRRRTRRSWTPSTASSWKSAGKRSSTPGTMRTGCAARSASSPPAA